MRLQGQYRRVATRKGFEVHSNSSMRKETDIEHIVARSKAHGIAPVHSDHPAYPCMRDSDNDGVVCE